MRKVDVAGLMPQPSSTMPIYHLSGVCLLQPGDPLPATVVDYLREQKVDGLYTNDSGESIAQLRLQLTHTAIQVDELEPGTKLDRPLYDQNGTLLLDGNTAVPTKFRDSLHRRGISQIYIRKHDEELHLTEGQALRDHVRRLIEQHRNPSATVEAAPKKVIDEQKVEEIQKIELKDASPEELSAVKLNQMINQATRIEVRPDGEAFAAQVRDRRTEGPATQEEKKAFTGVIHESVDVMDDVFGSLKQKAAKLSIGAIDKVASQAMGGVIQNRELLLLCGTSNGNGRDYLVNHAIATTVLAVNIGTTMGFSAGQVKCLAYGAMLADVGMLKVPEEIREKKEKLTAREVAEIKRHPVLGLDMLQRFNRIPRDVPYIVYQSHERPDGSGYPCRKKGSIIHTFARIVSTADTYAAMVSPRPYRGPHLPYFAMESLVRMCGKKTLDPEVVRAFLQVNSLCPLGSFVRLSDGRIGRVVSANPEDYTRPVITIIFKANGEKEKDFPRINLAEKKEIKIQEALDPKTLDVGEDAFVGI